MGLEKSLKLLIKDSLFSSTNKLVYEFAILKEEDCRDITNTKLHGDILILLHITFTYYYLAIILCSKLSHDGSQCSTRTTPSSPQVNYQW